MYIFCATDSSRPTEPQKQAAACVQISILTLLNKQGFNINVDLRVLEAERA